MKIEYDVAIPGVIYLNRGTPKSIRNFKSLYLLVNEETIKPSPKEVSIMIIKRIGKYIISYFIEIFSVWK